VPIPEFETQPRVIVTPVIKNRLDGPGFNLVTSICAARSTTLQRTTSGWPSTVKTQISAGNAHSAGSRSWSRQMPPNGSPQLAAIPVDKACDEDWYRILSVAVA